MLNEHPERDLIRTYEPKNPAKGLCTHCYNSISEFGRSKTKCEYHWLKRKYIKIQERVKENKDRNSSIIEIKLKMTWKEFIRWANENQDYKHLVDPALTRKDMGEGFYPENLKWVEFHEVSKY